MHSQTMQPQPMFGSPTANLSGMSRYLPQPPTTPPTPQQLLQGIHSQLPGAAVGAVPGTPGLSPARSSPAVPTVVGRSPLERPEIVSSQQYSGEFVQRLERRLQDEMETLAEASLRRVAQKEAEKEAEMRRAEEELAEVRREHAAAEAQQRSELEAVVAAHARELQAERERMADLEARHQREMDEVQQRHIGEIRAARREAEEAVQQVCDWTRDQVGTMDSKLSSQLDEMAMAKQTAEAVHLRQIHQMQEQHNRDLHEVRAMLDMETQRADALKRELGETNEARRTDMQALLAKMESCVRVMDQKELEHTSERQQLLAQLREQETQHKADALAQTKTHELEQQQLQYQVALLKEKVAVLVRRLKGVEETHKDQVLATVSDNRTLTTTVSDLQATCHRQHEAAQSAESRALAAERERTIVQNELALVANEERRLRDENTELRREVARLDAIIYGKR